MKKYSQFKTATGPSKGKFVVLRQICNLIPPFQVAKLARETGVDAQARSYTPWSLVVTLLYAQLVHATPGRRSECPRQATALSSALPNDSSGRAARGPAGSRAAPPPSPRTGGGQRKRAEGGCAGRREPEAGAGAGAKRDGWPRLVRIPVALPR